ncbi:MULTISPECIES: hypothetical protein [Bacillaceae]|uniref:hypothetical protein n=1 Tax=Bacillaceae TaxID=186817 RepID=UPI000E736170|nr:hypothetical protein [Bacillus sp. PK3_68]RJS61880.1 hypothetical protein CJ483_19050 [Bacillus sp. PK3_68]
MKREWTISRTLDKQTGGGLPRLKRHAGFCREVMDPASCRKGFIGQDKSLFMIAVFPNGRGNFFFIP